MTSSLEAVEADLQRALDRLVLAVTAAIPPGNDVLDPQQMVRQWMVQLAPEARARFLMLMLSESEARLDGIVRAVLAGDDAWTRPELDASPSPTVGPDLAASPDLPLEPA